MNLLNHGLLLLGQLKSLAPDDPRLEESSEVMTLVLGAVFVVGILLVAFRPSKRDRSQS